MPTTPSQFRLTPETLEDLDKISIWLAITQGIDPTRSAAVRYAARRTVIADLPASEQKLATKKLPKKGK